MTDIGTFATGIEAAGVTEPSEKGCATVPTYGVTRTLVTDAALSPVSVSTAGAPEVGHTGDDEEVNVANVVQVAELEVASHVPVHVDTTYFVMLVVLDAVMVAVAEEAEVGASDSVVPDAGAICPGQKDVGLRARTAVA